MPSSPPESADTTRIIGVDEAGKGPVLGSMFAAAVSVPAQDILDDDITDSKDLSPDQISDLATRLKKNPDVKMSVAELTPAQIDAPDTSMTALTAATQAAALNPLPLADVEEVIVDAGEKDTDSFENRVQKRVTHEPVITAEHEADATHAVVGAASIIAKHRREEHMEILNSNYETDVGSGYPGDSTTLSFLRNYVAHNDELPGCARESWETSQEALETARQQELTSF